MNENAIYWVAFNLVKGIGPVRLGKLLNYFGDIQEAWKAPDYQLHTAGLNQKLIHNLVEVRKQVSLKREADKIDESGLQVLTWDDPDYPERLRVIAQSPYVLYIKGELTLEDKWGVAIVGTRRFTVYGQNVTEELSQVMARHGISVISGLARGIDGIAHQSALAAGGRSIAVLGSGLDCIYPPEHKSLAEEISKNGALISDYPLGTPPDGSNFPPRNRIISGLSKAVIIIEAGVRSGALITAGYAADQGKDVFALPGKITSPMSRGCNLLLKQGAHPLLEPQDILDLLNLKSMAGQRTARQYLPGDPKEALLFQIIGQEPLHVDEISNQTQLPIETVISTLTLMELKGMVRKTFGMKYVAIKERYAGYDQEDKER
jgi:DNA processing protein